MSVDRDFLRAVMAGVWISLCIVAWAAMLKWAPCSWFGEPKHMPLISPTWRCE